MFERFDEKRVKVRDLELFLRRGGDGPPVVLLHGYPQSHVMWHKVAANLAKRFSVFAFDLPGFGENEGPPLTESHINHSKRETANTLIAAMGELGSAKYWKFWERLVPRLVETVRGGTQTRGFGLWALPTGRGSR